MSKKTFSPVSSAAFTRQTLRKAIRARRHHQSEGIWDMKHFFRTASGLAAIAVSVMAVSATTYALASTGFLNTLFTSEQIQKDNSRVISISTTACNDTRFDPATSNLTNKDGSRHYRIIPGSHLTNEQATQMVQGTCELTVLPQVERAITAQAAQHPEYKDRLTGGYMNDIITDITPTSITVKTEIPGGAKGIATFKRIAQDVLVTNREATMQWSDLKVGDSVVLAWVFDTPYATETTSEVTMDTTNVTIVRVQKKSPNAAASLTLKQTHGNEIEEVYVCDKVPSHFCTAEQMMK